MAVDINKFTNDFVTEWNGRKLNVNGAHVNFDGRYGIQCMDLGTISGLNWEFR